MIDMKLKVKPWRVIWRFLIVLAVILAIVFSSTISVFYDFANGEFYPWKSTQTIIVVAMVVLAVVAFIPSITASYYVCENSYFLQVKYGREYQFDYKNIEFIDFEKSEKKDMVIFYTRSSKMRYLLADENGVLLKTLKKKCDNLMDKDEFYRVHPEER